MTSPPPPTSPSNATPWGEDYSAAYELEELGEPAVPPAHRAALALYALIFLLGVPGNGAVLWVTALQLRRTVNGVWFLNLALADLLCCLALPFLALPLARDHHWPLGGLACRLLPSCAVLSMFASVLLLTALSADRCALVARPLWCHRRRAPPLARGVCAAAWGLAALLTLPTLAFRAARRDPLSAKVVCALSYAAAGPHRRLAELATAGGRFLAGFLLPFAVIAACYGTLLARLRRRGLAGAGAGGRRPPNHQRATCLVLVVVVSFFACWLPYHAVGLVLAAAPSRSPLFKRAQAADPLVAGVAYVNSCLNPFIYVIAGRGLGAKLRRSWQAALRGALGEEPPTTAGGGAGGSRAGSGGAAAEERSGSTLV